VSEANNSTRLVETNGSKFEVYAALGEVFGSGCPLGYLLVQSPSADGGTEGAKERLITRLLKHLRDRWNFKPSTTLSDKDWSEINAFLQVYPQAKHQLCFWHDLRAIKTRLATLRRKPAHYDVNEARREFVFIKPDFVPDAQADDPEEVGLISIDMGTSINHIFLGDVQKIPGGREHNTTSQGPASWGTTRPSSTLQCATRSLHQAQWYHYLCGSRSRVNALGG
jgi:MULE transposase domain